MKTTYLYILFIFLTEPSFNYAFSRAKLSSPQQATIRKTHTVDKDTILIKYTSTSKNQSGYDILAAPAGYITLQGDTVIPIGKYNYCYTDTLRNYAIVLTNERECIAIDKNDKKLFKVFWFDTGPDYIKEGLFRIIGEDGKIGYANDKGEIVIKPQFAFGFPFENGIAKVTKSGEEKSVPSCNSEYRYWDSDEWFYINTKGEKVNK
ncbi:WG repeat-containing protein [Parabacteroides pacaensis]|uniref:WG repeat-containing protein n=1 Tax=Parabacteroides pacaensis TaxID=2086575 RepID=UPI000D10A7BE|nr:WG repeat-containing protein [Parabacteroides pacaensis]